jgi:hypothetical protein
MSYPLSSMRAQRDPRSLCYTVTGYQCRTAVLLLVMRTTYAKGMDPYT